MTRLFTRFGRISWALGVSALLGTSVVGCKDKAEITEPPATDYDPQPAAQDGTFWSPFDAAPSPQADMVYFTALTADGAGVFKTASQNGTPERLHVGEPLVSPFGIMPDTANSAVFVVDSATEGMIDEEDVPENTTIGRIYRIPTTGGTPTSLSGAEGTSPKSLDIVSENGSDVIYFTGMDPETQEAAIFKMDTNGASRELVASGNPLMAPSGIAVHSDGTIYVADTAGPNGAPAVLRVRGGSVEVYQADLLVGYPAGVALTLDEKALFVSGLKAEEGTSVVHVLNLEDDTIAEFDRNISQNMQSAGVHRAHEADAFAWANADGDEDNPNGGTVYFIPRR